ncbi:unnamed protein product [Microthlaspi erraticum]|uniref:F-box domain-containing protein n=1 Tax=Microthlaspi erraticum TaxID=1685480 RepID=A0A6D2I9U9_9BRAS|nr:unnamed protein product [Microthlaspi erraticum]
MAVILSSDPLSRIHPEPQTLEIDHFDYLPDSVLLLVFNKIGDVKALGRCCVVSKRFHFLVRVDCIISPRTNPPPSLPISLDLPPPVPSPPYSVSLQTLGQFLGTKRSSGSSGSSSSSSSSNKAASLTKASALFAHFVMDQDPVLVSRSTVFEGRCFQNLERCGGMARYRHLLSGFCLRLWLLTSRIGFILLFSQVEGLSIAAATYLAWILNPGKEFKCLLGWRFS